MNHEINTGNYLKNKIVLIILVLLLIVTIILSTALGAVNVPFLKTFSIILKNLGMDFLSGFSESQESIIFHVRFPRVIGAVLVGAALSTSGCVMQGMFRNPMADPGVIGISSGASLGAVIAVSFGLTSLSIYSLPLCAIVGAFLASFVIYMLTVQNGKIPVLTLILSGIAVGAFFHSISSFILTRMREHEIREYLFWSVGSLDGKRWEHIGLVVIPLFIALIVLLFFSKELNILMIGEEEAHSVGLNPSKTRKRLLFFASIATAMGVCISGNISFVGLIVPHIMRLIVGPDNRILLPASALAGGIFLTACDLLGRLVIMPEEVGVGIVTSMIGAPYFLYLLTRVRKGGIAV